MYQPTDMDTPGYNFSDYIVDHMLEDERDVYLPSTETSSSGYSLDWGLGDQGDASMAFRKPDLSPPQPLQQQFYDLGEDRHLLVHQNPAGDLLEPSANVTNAAATQPFPQLSMANSQAVSTPEGPQEYDEVVDQRLAKRSKLASNTSAFSLSTTIQPPQTFRIPGQSLEAPQYHSFASTSADHLPVPQPHQPLSPRNIPVRGFLSPSNPEITSMSAPQTVPTAYSVTESLPIPSPTALASSSAPVDGIPSLSDEGDSAEVSDGRDSTGAGDRAKLFFNHYPEFIRVYLYARIVAYWMFWTSVTALTGRKIGKLFADLWDIAAESVLYCVELITLSNPPFRIYFKFLKTTVFLGYDPTSILIRAVYDKLKEYPIKFKEKMRRYFIQDAVFVRESRYTKTKNKRDRSDRDGQKAGGILAPDEKGELSEQLINSRCEDIQADIAKDCSGNHYVKELVFLLSYTGAAYPTREDEFKTANLPVGKAILADDFQVRGRTYSMYASLVALRQTFLPYCTKWADFKLLQKLDFMKYNMVPLGLVSYVSYTIDKVLDELKTVDLATATMQTNTYETSDLTKTRPNVKLSVFTDYVQRRLFDSADSGAKKGKVVQESTYGCE